MPLTGSAPAAATTADAINWLWSIGPGTLGAADWINGGSAHTLTLDGLAMLIEPVSANWTALGPDGSTGIRLDSGSTGNIAPRLRADVGALVTLGSITRSPGDLWIVDMAWTPTTVAGTCMPSVGIRDAATSNAYLIADRMISANTILIEAGATTRTIPDATDIRRLQIHVEDLGLASRGSMWSEVHPVSQDPDDLDARARYELTGADPFAGSDQVWFRFDVGSSADFTITDLGIGYIASADRTRAVSGAY